MKIAPTRQNLVIFLLIAFFSGNLLASEPRFSHLGLQQGGINALTQDNYGFVWIGTKNGLIRYDGNVVQTYQNSPDDPASLQDNAIIALHYGKDRRLWVGTEASGASYYNYATGQFTRIDSSIIGNHIYRFFDDDTGQGIYAQTASGVFFIDQNDQAKLILSTKYSELVLGIYANQQGIHTILETGQKLTLGNDPDRPEISRIFPATLIQYWSVESCPQLIREPIQAGGGSGLFHCLQDNKMVKAGLNRTLQDANINPGQLLVYDLLEDDDGIIWISSDLGLLRVMGEQVTIIKSPGFDGHSLSSNKLSVLLAGQKNTLFIGTQDKGLNILSLDNTGISHFPTLTTADRTGRKTAVTDAAKPCPTAIETSQPTLWSTLKDAEGDLWVGSHTGLTYKPSGSGTFQDHSRLGHQDRFIDLCSVRALAEAGGQIWIGTQTGLIAYDKQQRTVVRYPNQSSVNKHHPSVESSVRVLRPDKKRGSLWVGTDNAGLYRIDLKSRQVHYFPHAANNPTARPDNQIHSIYLSHDNRLWIGTSSGLSLWNEDNNTFRTITATDNPATLSNASVHTIHQSDQDHLWLGTANGLNLFGIKEFSVKKRLYERNGLVDSTIYSLTPDDQGHYWISTANGLSHFDPVKEIFKNYYPAHKLQSGGFNTNAWHKDRKGLLYLGGIAGLTIINPAKFTNDAQSHPPVMTHIDGFDPRGSHSYLAQMLSPTDNLPTKSLRRTIRLNFTYPFFGDAELLQSQYRLFPVTQDWSETNPGTHYVDYSNLKPGAYDFQLRANLTNNQAASFKFTIEPYFWETIWFKTLVLIVLLILTIFLSIYFYRFWSKFSAEKMTRQHYRIVEHELRPHLNEADKQLKSLLQSPDLTIKDKQVIRFSVIPLIAKSMDFIAELRTLVDLRRAAKQPKQLYLLEDVLDEALLFFKDYPRQIIIGDIADLDIKTHQDAVYLLVKNLISNAIKYSPGGEPVYLNVHREQKSLVIECIDQGIGISKDKRKAIYEPYKRFTGEYKNINGQGIGLAIVRFIVHTYQGSINIEDNQPQGSRFIVKLKGVVADDKQ